MIEQSIAAIYVIQDGKIVYVNPRMREIFGCTPDEAFDPNLLARVTEPERPKVIEQIARRINGEGDSAY